MLYKRSIPTIIFFLSFLSSFAIIIHGNFDSQILSDSIIYKNSISNSLCKLITNSIKKAKHRVYISSMGINDFHVIQALNIAIRKGLDVCIISESVEKGSYMCTLEGADWTKIKVKNGIHHQKFVIADDFCIIGSANLTITSLHRDANDLIAFNSKEMSDLIVEYVKSYRYKEENLFLKEIKVINHKSGVTLSWIPLYNDNFSIENEINTIIRETDSKIYGAMFFFTDLNIYNLLLGLDYKIAVNQNKVNILGSNIFPCKYYGKIHSKSLFSKEWAIMGSSNFSRNRKKNVECMILIRPNIFYKEMKDYVLRCLDYSTC